MTIPIASPTISEATVEAVRDVLNSGMLADGEVVRAFESEFADYVGVDHAVATSSGTTALHAMLEAAGVGEGDAVVTTAFSFVASANAIVHAGAEPVFVDIEPRTFNLDPAEVDAVLDRRDDIAAILAVHLYGHPAAMDELGDIADEHGVALFEDAAQAHGATVQCESVGSLGDIAAFSFYPTKNMTTGEGGMITTDDPDLATRARQFADHGRTATYRHEFVGYNYRMTNIAAAIGRNQLERLPGWVERRRRNATNLSELLSVVEEVETPYVAPKAEHAFNQYTLQVENRRSVTATLDNGDIGYRIYYPRTIPNQPAFSDGGDYPVAQRASSTVISLPIHPGVSREEVREIGRTIGRAVGVPDVG